MIRNFIRQRFKPVENCFAQFWCRDFAESRSAEQNRMNFHAGEVSALVQSGDNYQAFSFERISNVAGDQTSKAVEAKRRAILRSRHNFRPANPVRMRSRNQIESELGERIHQSRHLRDRVGSS